MPIHANLTKTMEHFSSELVYLHYHFVITKRIDSWFILPCLFCVLEPIFKVDSVLIVLQKTFHVYHVVVEPARLRLFSLSGSLVNL